MAERGRQAVSGYQEEKLRLACEIASCHVPRMKEQIASDARFADLAKVRQARRLSPEMKFRAGSDLFEEACQWSLAGIAARFPGASVSERQEKLRHYLQLAEVQGKALDWTYIETWCAEHGTLEVLAEAKAAAAPAWEDDL